MVHRELDVGIADRTKPGLRLTRCVLENVRRVPDISPAVDDSYLASGEDEEEGVADSTVASRSTRERLRIAAARYLDNSSRTQDCRILSFSFHRMVAFQ